MKKIILTALVAVVSLAANAQVWAGGSLGFETSHNNGFDKSKNTVTIAPELGYTIDENLDIAVALEYNHASGTVTPTNKFAIKPYARYAFAKSGNFSAFIDCGLNVASAHVKGMKDNANTVGVFVTPGIAYAVSPKVSLVAHFGDGLYYNHTWLKDISRNNTAGLNLMNGISFGAYYAF